MFLPKNLVFLFFLASCAGQTSLPTSIDSGIPEADAGAVTATKAIVQIGDSWALVTSTFSDGSSVQESYTNADTVCDSGYTSLDLVGLSGDPLAICVPSNLACPQLPYEAVEHQTSDVMTFTCKATNQ